MNGLTEKVKEAVYQQTSFLSGLANPDLEELLNLSKWDRRVRNVTPLYALFFQQDKWRELLEKSNDVSSLQLQFKKALSKLEQSDSDVSLVAKELKHRFFSKGKMFMIENRNDVSEEMAKLLQSLVRSVRLNDTLSEETQKSLNQRLSNVDFENLLH